MRGRVVLLPSEASSSGTHLVPGRIHLITLLDGQNKLSTARLLAAWDFC
jgi:hypothetical protein